ncbi:MAG: nitronate monooxygenase family protein [Lachnospiraceae bacterium]|nr:nitronate monooxygenase family protein [Lachnospiraceae bacterium]
MKRKELKIGNLTARIPLIQGGMGVGVSLSGLSGAVAAAGGVGIISTAQIGYRDPDFDRHPIECNLKAIHDEIAKARKIANGGIVGVNIMVATKRYEDYVKAAADAGADIIISGAGLPMTLPTVSGDAKIAPVVSSRKSLSVISRYWNKKFGRKPDLVVIEGPQAGGHLGFSREDIEEYTAAGTKNYADEIVEILKLAAELEVPVAVAGGVYERADMEHYLDMGADAVQVATRFVTTKECDASDAFKQAYINAKKEDIVIVKSPVGMPGRAIHNAFLDRVAQGERFMSQCHHCISMCNPATIPYCITDALVNAVKGNIDEGLVFCGSNAWRADKIETVADIMEEFS